MNDVSWGALALTLTLLGALWTWWSWRNRGVVAGVRGVAWTLLPVAAWLTGLLPLLGQLTSAVSTWVTRLVFSPVVWAGVILAGLSAVLFVVTGFIDRRRGPVRAVTSSTAAPSAVSAPSDEFADIEALLRERGIQ